MSFEISRLDGDASVTANLRCIAYLRPLAAWQHETGAWLVLGVLPNSPSIYSVHWRASEMSGTGSLAFAEGAFQEPDEVKGWLRALKLAHAVWEAGPPAAIVQKASGIKDKQREGNTKGGHKSGETRSQQAEERRAALELAKKFGLSILPEYDPRVWEFAPMRDLKDRPVIQFRYKKMLTTFAYMGQSKQEYASWEIGRQWHPGMNDDNAPITEVCLPDIGGSEDAKDPAYIAFAKLLKTDPAQWARGDYLRFAP